jgi:hypothetical protein
MGEKNDEAMRIREMLGLETEAEREHRKKFMSLLQKPTYQGYKPPADEDDESND